MIVNNNLSYSIPVLPEEMNHKIKTICVLRKAPAIEVPVSLTETVIESLPDVIKIAVPIAVMMGVIGSIAYMAHSALNTYDDL